MCIGLRPETQDNVQMTRYLSDVGGKMLFETIICFLDTDAKIKLSKAWKDVSK